MNAAAARLLRRPLGLAREAVLMVSRRRRAALSLEREPWPKCGSARPDACELVGLGALRARLGSPPGRCLSPPFTTCGGAA
jgi:hypothetical protein